MKLEDRPTPETLELRSHLEEQVGIGSYGWSVAFEAMAGKCCDLERELAKAREEIARLVTKDYPNKQLMVELILQRDGLLAALLGVLEDWEGGYRPEDCGTTMAIAREAIAEVKGAK